MVWKARWEFGTVGPTLANDRMTAIGTCTVVPGCITYCTRYETGTEVLRVLAYTSVGPGSGTPLGVDGVVILVLDCRKGCTVRGGFCSIAVQLCQ